MHRGVRFFGVKFLGVGFILGLLIATAMTASAAGGDARVDRSRGHFVRWDIVQIVNGVVLPGGTAVAQDQASGDKVFLTGSGQAKPGPRQATGSGTFEHRHGGTVVARGAYFVTGFVSWDPAGGSLAGTGLRDGIGPIDETSAGELSLRVHLVPTGGAGVDGVLTIHCDLPGDVRHIEEGVSLTVGPFHFVQVPEQGFTLFHILH